MLRLGDENMEIILFPLFLYTLEIFCNESFKKSECSFSYYLARLALLNITPSLMPIQHNHEEYCHQFTQFYLIFL